MIGAFLESEVAPFVALAKQEGWISGEWELEFLRRQFPQGCLVWREGGETLGYITSIKHGHSGWIGNLLVAQQARRRGIGAQLMQGALQALIQEETATIWLTASAKGIGIYQRLGFVAIDEVNRWEGEGKGPGRMPVSTLDPELVRQVDRAGWGDLRQALLETTCNRGLNYSADCSFLCCQHWQEGTQLGPWGALFDSQAEPLLDQALATLAGRVFLDVPAGNLAACGMLSRRGFKVCGNSVLMYLGMPPRYQPGKVFALASMGSMG